MPASASGSGQSSGHAFPGRAFAGRTLPPALAASRSGSGGRLVFGTPRTRGPLSSGTPPPSLPALPGPQSDPARRLPPHATGGRVSFHPVVDPGAHRGGSRLCRCFVVFIGVQGLVQNQPGALSRASSERTEDRSPFAGQWIAPIKWWFRAILFSGPLLRLFPT